MLTPALKPYRLYNKNGWVSWGEFLGTNYIATKLRKYRKFSEVKKFFRSNNIKSNKDWQTFCKTKKKPSDIPADLYQIYKNEFTGFRNLFNKTK